MAELNPVDSLPNPDQPGQALAVTKLNSYRIEGDVYARDLFAYGLARYLAVWAFLATVVAVVVGLLATNWFAAGVVWCYIFFLFGLLSRWSTCSKVQKNPLNRNVWAAVEAEFDEATFRVWASTGSASQIPFKNYVKVVRFRGKYLMYLTAGQYMIVPSTAFKSHVDERKFQEILVRYSMLKTVDK